MVHCSGKLQQGTQSESHQNILKNIQTCRNWFFLFFFLFLPYIRDMACMLMHGKHVHPNLEGRFTNTCAKDTLTFLHPKNWYSQTYIQLHCIKWLPCIKQSLPKSQNYYPLITIILTSIKRLWLPFTESCLPFCIVLHLC